MCAQGHAPSTRVVILSLVTHHAGRAQWHDLQSTRGYSPFLSYAGRAHSAAYTQWHMQLNDASAAAMHAPLSRMRAGRLHFMPGINCMPHASGPAGRPCERAHQYLWVPRWRQVLLPGICHVLAGMHCLLVGWDCRCYATPWLRSTPPPPPPCSRACACACAAMAAGTKLASAVMAMELQRRIDRWGAAAAGPPAWPWALAWAWGAWAWAWGAPGPVGLGGKGNSPSVAGPSGPVRRRTGRGARRRGTRTAQWRCTLASWTLPWPTRTSRTHWRT